MKNKSPRGRVRVIAGMLLFVLALLAEMYVMINEPMQYTVIAALGVLTLGCAYIAVNGFLVMYKERSLKSDEQNGYIYKSGKASLLVSKKNFEEIGAKLSRMEKTSQIPTEEIVNAQKGIAKAIMNHNRENTDALMDSNNSMAAQLKAMSDRLDALAQAVVENRVAIDANREAVNTAVSASQELAGGVSEKTLRAQEQGLLDGMKQMELRMNNMIMQLQEAAQKSMKQASIAPAEDEVSSVQPAAKEPSIKTDMPAGELLGVDAVFADAEDALAGLVNELPGLALDPNELPESGSDMTLAEEHAPEPETVREPEVMSEVAAEPEALPESGSDMSLMEDLTPEPEVTAEVEVMPEMVTEPEAVDELPKSGAAELLTEEPEAITEPIEKEIPAMPDLSDPNKALTLDEIDALFANMGVEVPETKLPTEPEPVFTPDVIMDSNLFDAPQDVSEPAIGNQPDMPGAGMPAANAAGAAEGAAAPSDSDKPLSLSEIDELIASIGNEDMPAAEPEPIPEAKPAMPDLSDPNKAMSPEEIAALFANLA